jgi:hypothetical protein
VLLCFGKQDLMGIYFGVKRVLKNDPLNTQPIPRTRSWVLLIFSRVSSFIFHPLFIPVIMTWVLYKAVPQFFSTIPPAEFRRWICILALTIILLPFLVIGLLRVFRLISNARMHNPRDRVLPLVGTLIFYAWAFYFFTERVTAPLLLRSLLLGSCLSIVIIFFINIYYKVSIHTTAAAIMPGILIVLLATDPQSIIVAFVLAVMAALLVGIVRWLLGAHTPGQIILGYIIGISMQVAAYLFLRTPGF